MSGNGWVNYDNLVCIYLFTKYCLSYDHLVKVASLWPRPVYHVFLSLNVSLRLDTLFAGLKGNAKETFHVQGSLF